MELLDELDDVLGRLADVELSRSDDVVRLHTQLARLDALTTRTVGSWDAAGEWRADGARSAPAWLAARCRTPLPSARRRVRLGRVLRHLPAAEKAWLAGDIESAHVAALASVRNDRTAEAFARDEAMLVEDATQMRFRHFQNALAYWLQHADPDGAEDKASKQHDDRRVDLSQTFAGMWVGDLLLDPIGGSILAASLRTIEGEFWQADWSEARDRLGRDPLVHELARTPKQRRADALVEMAIRARTVPAGGRRPEPLFTVLVGYEQFQHLCELWNHTVVTPGSLVPYLDRAWIERAVFEGPSRVIDIGEHQRFFRGATRRAVELVSGGECFSDLCDADPDDLQADHKQPWSVGGPTVQANGRLACGFHNRRRHKRRPNTG